MFVAIPTRSKERNGATARKWTLQQTYNVDVVASDPSTPDATLLDIVANGSGRHVALVASNKGISAKVAEAIYADKPTHEISGRLATNPATPGSILEKIANRYNMPGEENTILVSKAARNPNLPVAVLLTMLPDLDYANYQWTIELSPYKDASLNPSAPIKELLSSLKFMKDYETKLSVAKRRKSDILQYLATNHGVTLVKPTPDSIVKAVRKLGL